MSSTFITQLAGATRLTVHGRGSCRRPCIQGESLDFDCVDRCLCLLESGHLPVSPPGTCFRPWSAPCRARAANFIPCPIQFPSAYLWGVLEPCATYVRGPATRHPACIIGDCVPAGDTGGRPLSDAAKPPVSSRTLLERVYTERTASSRVKQNTVASTIIRCSTTPMRRARATVARFLPRRAARRNAQASVMGQLMSSTFITQLAGATRLTVHGRGSCRRPCIQGESLDFDCVDRCLCLLESGHLPVSPPGTCFRPWSAPCRARAANFIPCPIQFPSAYLWGVLEPCATYVRGPATRHPACIIGDCVPGRDTGGRPLSDAAKPPVSSRTLLERVYTERTASSRVKQNTVASTIIRCSTTPMRRARATVARFLPRRAARRNAQAFSQLDLPPFSMTVAA